MPISPDTFANFATSLVNGGTGGPGTNLGQTDTTLYVSPGQGALFPTTGNFPLILGPNTLAPELAWCTSRTGDALTLLRSQEGTSAPAGGWSNGTLVTCNLTAGVLQHVWNVLVTTPQVQGTPSFSHHVNATTAVTLQTYTPPADGLYAVFGYARVKNGTSNNDLTVSATFADPNSANPTDTLFLLATNGATGAQVLCNGSNGVVNGFYSFGPFVLEATTTANIVLSYQDPTNTPNDWVSLFIARWY